MRGMFMDDDLERAFDLSSLEQLTYGAEWRSSSLSPTWKAVQLQVYPEEFSDGAGLSPAFFSKLPKGKGDFICESSSADLNEGECLPLGFPIVPKPIIRKKSMQRSLASPPISPTRKTDSKKDPNKAGKKKQTASSPSVVQRPSLTAATAGTIIKKQRAIRGKKVKKEWSVAPPSAAVVPPLEPGDLSSEKDRKWFQRMMFPHQMSDEFMSKVFKDEAYRNAVQHTFALMQEEGSTASSVLGCAFIVLAVARDYYTLGSCCFNLEAAKDRLIFNKVVDLAHKRGEMGKEAGIAEFESVAKTIHGPLCGEQRTSMHGMIDDVWSWLFKGKYLVQKGGPKEYYAEKGSLPEKVIDKIYELKKKPENKFCSELAQLL